MITQEMKDSWKRKVYSVNDADIRQIIILTDWGASLMESVTERVKEGIDLTMQQSIALNSIYRRIK